MNIQFDRNELEEVKSKHNLSLIILHGSQVDGKTHPKSDVDIAVVRADDKQKLKLLELIKDLSAVFKTGKVDVSDLTHADPLFLFSALNKAELLAGKSKDYSAILKLAFHKYNDYLPYLLKEREFVINKIRTYVTT